MEDLNAKNRRKKKMKRETTKKMRQEAVTLLVKCKKMRRNCGR